MTTPFAEAFAELDRRPVKGPAWVRDLRQQAYVALTETGLPTRRDEDWKYTSLRAVSEGAFRLPESVGAPDMTLLALLESLVVAGETTLVFIDGQLSTAHSRLSSLPAGLSILPIGEALAQAPLGAKDAKDWIAQPGEGQQPSASTPFEHLSRAFFGETGTLITVMPGAEIQAPIHLLHLTTAAAQGRITLPRHRLVATDGAKVSVVETFAGAAGTDYLTVPVTEIMVASGARVSHCRIQIEGRSASHVGALRASVAGGGRFASFALGTGAKLSRLGLDVSLLGEDAEASLDGLYVVKGDQHLDNHTTVDHRSPNTRSDQVYKGVLSDAARAVFNGKVIIREGAGQSSAGQLNQNLLLSSDAEIDTKPELQIDTDDVKCSHGAAIGRLDADEIFYLQSRGLTRGESERMLLGAFAEDVVNRFGEPAVLARLSRLAREALA